MAYRILIERIETVASVQRGDYVVIERRPWTDEDFNERSKYLYNDSEKSLLDKEPLKEIRGYAPDRPVTIEKTTKLLEVNVAELDLPAVVKSLYQLK